MDLIQDNDIENFGSDDDDDAIYIFFKLLYFGFHKMQSSRRPCKTFALKGHDYVIELLNGNERRCFDYFRMKRATFITFCEDLKAKTKLKVSRYPRKSCYIFISHII